MPNYTFENTKTGEVFDEFFSISDKETYLKKNKHIKQLLTAINIVGGVQGITHKTDGGWNDNLQRIADAHPTSALADRVKRKSIKEVKTQQVMAKHRKRQQRKK